MSGMALMTNSPSSRKSSRKTPCVEGCCGPIESVICDSNGWSRNSTSFGKFSTAVDIKFYTFYFKLLRLHFYCYFARLVAFFKFFARNRINQLELGITGYITGIGKLSLKHFGC